MRAEPKRGKGFGGTILTLLLTALVVGGSFLAAALMEYTIPRESDETVELGDIREPVVYPAGGDVKMSLYPWNYYDKRKTRALEDGEKQLEQELEWMIQSILQIMGTYFPDMDLYNLFEVITHNGITYYFVNGAQLTSMDGVQYTLDCAFQQFDGMVYFMCRPQATISREQWQYSYKTLEKLFTTINPFNISDITSKEIIGEIEMGGLLKELSENQFAFLQSLQCLATAVEQYTMYRFQSLFTIQSEAEILLTDSDLMVIGSGYQMNVLFIDPQTCRIIGCGSAA